MCMDNFLAYSGKILFEVIGDIFYFPFWWYTKGLYNFTKKILVFLSNKEKSSALFVWLKNIFVPMYGQSDWQGKLVSFFMRLVQIIFRTIVMIFWLIVALSCIMSWLILPLFVIYEIIFQLNG
jgi:hypothetical protein